MGNFQKLIVWQKSKDLAVEIYKLTNDGKFNNDFRLRDQMRASAVSIASNIAEGDELQTNKQSVNFFYIAKGSVAELKTQIIISNEIAYISKIDADSFIISCDEIGKMLTKLINIRKENEKPNKSNSKFLAPNT
ncbi:MAG: four helix bundle protein [Saprospiraceae bacterium]|nr:four helix bundle protein [Saprospiraceae bacterium]MBK8547837.1 four helix bundle protein [Saprospiraceae bacterium]MBK8818697.1 four helix bundle protein [Saprospiraceae bacterium]MBK9042475.1 four helix bundle protein [Saprospiraceae bacterium]